MGPAARLPIVLVGARDHLLELDPAVQGMARQFLMDSWQPEEALVRLFVAVTDQRRTLPHGRGSDQSAGSDQAGRARVKQFSWERCARDTAAIYKGLA